MNYNVNLHTKKHKYKNNVNESEKFKYLSIKVSKICSKIIFTGRQNILFIDFKSLLKAVSNEKGKQNIHYAYTRG